MGKVWVALSVLITALVLAGCTDRYGGEAAREPTTGEPLTHDVLGDPRTVDPCSLTGPAAFEPHGIARMPGKPDMDACQVTVTTDDGKVLVRVGKQVMIDPAAAGGSGHTGGTGQATPGSTDLGRGATVVRLKDGCDTALRLSDGHAIMATATAAPDAHPTDDLLCQLTRGAAEGVFNVLAGGRVKHWAPEPNSFATHIACGVLAPEVVAAQLGSLTSTTPSAAGHQCGWSTKNGSGNSVTLTFPVVESAADLGVPAGTPTEPVAGRESWVATTDDGCAVYTRHIEFEPGAGTFEFAALAVTMRGDACGVARALASSAWQNLPPFS